MQNRITSGTVMALACSAVLVSAAPQSRPNTGAPPGASGAGVGAARNQNQQTTTITGCLRQGSTAHSFVLTQSPGTSVPDGGVGTAGGRDTRGNRYELLADSKTDLSKMVGRQVRVTGMQTLGPANPAPGTSRDLSRERTGDQPAAGGGTGERDRAPGDASLTRFNVQRITETGSSC